MNLIEKIISYIELRNGGFNHQVAKQEFKRSPLTFEDKVVIGWLLIVAIVVAVLVYDAQHSKKIEAMLEQQRIAEHQRKIAENQAIKHEEIVLTMLNGGYVKLDGVTRKVCVKDYNGDCI